MAKKKRSNRKIVEPSGGTSTCAIREHARKRQLYLDADGVLADFDAAAERLLGMPGKQYEGKYGLSAFWNALAKSPDFFGRAPLMADARFLFEAVRHLDPIILTGLPRGDWAAPQKAKWAAKHFPGTRIITCMARDKACYCGAGDVLVDDQARHQRPWENAGGIFVLHKSAAETLKALAAYFPDIKVKTQPSSDRASVKDVHLSA